MYISGFCLLCQQKLKSVVSIIWVELYLNAKMVVFIRLGNINEIPCIHTVHTIIKLKKQNKSYFGYTKDY